MTATKLKQLVKKYGEIKLKVEEYCGCCYRTRILTNNSCIYGRSGDRRSQFITSCFAETTISLNKIVKGLMSYDRRHNQRIVRVYAKNRLIWKGDKQ